MAENENVLVGEVPENTETENKTPEQPLNNQLSKGKKFQAKIKEWFRKKVVALKRKPQMIALFLLAVTTIFFMLALYTISQAIDLSAANANVKATGICVFIVTLLSLLVLVSFLNSFPKRKKPNIFFIILVFVMIGAMIACDLVYYIQMNNCLADPLVAPGTSMYMAVEKAQPYILAHIVLLGVSAIVFALLPVYKRLINKIDTKVVLESATENMQGAIDIQED
jgi:phosphoglycerol transferase MdoB-like AlkP superfamily enzyme